MISRRQIRIKVLQALYAYLKKDEKDYVKSEKELLFSIRKMYDLYHYMFLLVIDVVHYAENRIELIRQRKISVPSDREPSTRFIDNKVIRQLKNNDQFNKYLNDNKLSWAQYPEMIKSVYNKLVETDEYKEYIRVPSITYHEEKKLILYLFESVLLPFDDLHSNLEEQSIYWNDDLEFVISIIGKTLKRFDEDAREGGQLLPLYKNTEDKEFARKLLRKAINNYDDHVKLVDSYTKNWELDRIALMDIILLNLAITEITDFESIPVKVSFNEYIEVSKYYSTKKSSVFINGVLDKIIHDLKKEGKVKKTGRGLVDD